MHMNSNCSNFIGIKTIYIQNVILHNIIKWFSKFEYKNDFLILTLRMRFLKNIELRLK